VVTGRTQLLNYVVVFIYQQKKLNANSFFILLQEVLFDTVYGLIIPVHCRRLTRRVCNNDELKNEGGWKMAKFIAVKIHYDGRPPMEAYLKFARPPTLAEHQEYRERFKEGVGGNGFHESMNFSFQDDSPVKVYLPPGYIPAEESPGEEEFVFLSFTYAEDPVKPAHVVGIHGGAHIVGYHGPGQLRRVERIQDAEPLYYHADSDPALTTLFAAPLPYDRAAGRYTPNFQKWGNGLRYIEPHHVRSILEDANRLAIDRLSEANEVELEFIARQLDVLFNINAQYRLGADLKKPMHNLTSQVGGWKVPGLPDSELGKLGEKMVYEQERAYVSDLGLDPSSVIWFSNSDPTAPYDIVTMRVTNGIAHQHFLEVKTSTSEEANAYISSYQIKVLQDASKSSRLVLVKIDNHRRLLSREDLSWEQLDARFKFVPIKYKLETKFG
jgi:hypothetical protein